MEAFLPEWLKEILVGLIALVIVLSWLAGRFPHIAWLRVFRLPKRQLSPEEEARRRRREKLMIGMEMILFGVVLPLGYGTLTVMMFNDFDPLVSALVLAGSAALVIGGIVVLARLR